MNAICFHFSLHNKELAVELTNSGYSDNTSFKTSRTGLIVPVILRDGREYSLHSLFDPEKEGARYAASVKGGGFIVVFGFGAGYHIKIAALTK